MVVLLDDLVDSWDDYGTSCVVYRKLSLELLDHSVMFGFQHPTLSHLLGPNTFIVHYIIDIVPWAAHIYPPHYDFHSSAFIKTLQEIWSGLQPARRIIETESSEHQPATNSSEWLRSLDRCDIDKMVVNVANRPTLI